jgi:uncharacterized membrane protein YoaK (UPF0700 family)
MTPQQILCLLISASTAFILGAVLGAALIGDFGTAVVLMIPLAMLIAALVIAFSQINPTDF